MYLRARCRLGSIGTRAPSDRNGTTVLTAMRGIKIIGLYLTPFLLSLNPNLPYMASLCNGSYSYRPPLFRLGTRGTRYGGPLLRISTTLPYVCFCDGAFERPGLCDRIGPGYYATASAMVRHTTFCFAVGLRTPHTLLTTVVVPPSYWRVLAHLY